MNKSNITIFESYLRISKNFKKKIIGILANPNLKKEYSHKINGRWENQYLDIDLMPEIKVILDFACQSGKKMIHESLVIPYKQLGFKTNEFWFNISEPGDSTGWHDHKEYAKLSGVFYIAIPKDSGDILFRKKNGNVYEEWSIQSEEDKIILFNSDLEHCVEKNDGDGKRISLAFNLYTLPIKLSESLESYSSNKFYS